MYAAKRMSYTPFVYKTRTLLAAVDYNKHNGRQPARNQDGKIIYVFMITVVTLHFHDDSCTSVWPLYNHTYYSWIVATGANTARSPSTGVSML